MVESKQKRCGLVSWCAAMGVIAVAVGSHASRLTWPSIFLDDAVRVAFCQTDSLGQSLFRPFNEHIAPGFELVTWLTWKVAGGSLVAAPLAFTLASFLPFVLVLWVLGLVARRELDPAGWTIAVSVFALSSLASEAVFWYSASSFNWALCALLGAWYAIARGAQARCWRSCLGWLGLAALLAAVAPCFCGLGLLAGPIAAVRWWVRDRDEQHGEVDPVTPGSIGGVYCWSSELLGLLPLLGNAAYLAMAMASRFHEILSASARRQLDLGTGLLCVVKACVDVLLPGLVGLPNLDRWVPAWLAVALLTLILMGIAVWCVRRPTDRPVVLTGLALILGGYGLTYPLRASADPVWVLTVQRYHLLPQAGLAVLVACALLPGLKWLRRMQPIWHPLAPLGLAMVLFVLHAPEIKRHARYSYYPEQGRTLAAMEKLAASARRLGLSREETIAALDPIRTAWLPDPRLFNAFQMLPAWPAPPRRGEHRPADLLSSLSPSDREALCWGMDASRYLQAVDDVPVAAEPGQLVRLSQARAMAGGARYQTAGELAFVEFAWPNGLVGAARPPRALLIDEPVEGELWWTDDEGQWSPTRSLTWTMPTPARLSILPLDRVPHWTTTKDLRVRVVIRRKEPVAVGTIKLIR